MEAALMEPIRMESRDDDIDGDDDLAAVVVYDDDTAAFPMEMLPESPAAIASCPRILTPNMLAQLMDALPLTVSRTMRCKRLYAIGRDGDSFSTMIEDCHSFSQTIVIMETSLGHILGGFASFPWEKRHHQIGCTKRRSFYGSGQSFLFATHPDDGDESKVSLTPESPHQDKHSEIHIYKWTGRNNYCQMCDAEDGLMAMGGGGGAFGWIVEDDFSRGSTGSCMTYGNPALIPGGGTFDVISFEVYGFTSMAEAFQTHFSPGHAKHSLLRMD